MFEEQHAVRYYSSIMTGDDVLLLKTLVSRIPKAPANARQYLQRHCRNETELEEFFRYNSYQFFVENKRVALYDDSLEAARENSVAYFREKLECCDGPVHYMKLKKHLDDATDSIASFVSRFYPGKQFKRFLRSRPDVFVVFEDSTVFLIEVESIAFFERMLESGSETNMPFLNFRGHIGQAPPHVQNYMNRYFPGDDFQDFLRNNSDVFALDEELKVSLVPLECK